MGALKTTCTLRANPTELCLCKTQKIDRLSVLPLNFRRMRPRFGLELWKQTWKIYCWAMPSYLTVMYTPTSTGCYSATHSTNCRARRVRPIIRTPRQDATNVSTSFDSIWIADSLEPRKQHDRQTIGNHHRSIILSNYLPFQYFGIGRTWWRLFQKRVVCNKCDIYGFIDDDNARRH